MNDPLIGCIVPWAGNYAPEGWYFCEGQQLRIEEFNALYAVIGNRFGGDLRNYFNLPNLKGRVIAGVNTVNWNQPNRLDLQALGQVGGSLTATVGPQNMPLHTHSGVATAPATVPAVNGNGSSGVPQAGDKLAKGSGARGAVVNPYTASTTPIPQGGGAAGALVSATIGPVGTNTMPVFSTVAPCLSVRFIIAVDGIFPIRP